ncbi:hypothetical protein LptCag_1295 [Leptospirillum ferriphilum]|uniref:Uncharacterized protein n=2 Tax=Leptospirillum ferriphilum TaxID=178606 RepID=A0A094W630_9BACT|nr:hypothetical protein [Leptospirillum ferriphilum]AFS53318.1 hypothetical protein LFML04_1088 [Leptospirillum ferriphilum ML-04]KGA92918.1 hypothetical protein LptCag_1295 [Leptospirillum ferriphilum]
MNETRKKSFKNPVLLIIGLLILLLSGLYYVSSELPHFHAMGP